MSAHAAAFNNLRTPLLAMFLPQTSSLGKWERRAASDEPEAFPCVLGKRGGR